jgi:hypothetical protein
MFINFCSDQVGRSEWSNMAFYRTVYFFSMNCKMDCLLIVNER